MDVTDWDARYRSEERAAEDLQTQPTKLIVQTAWKLLPGKALDLACGTGRNAVWLAQQGWNVTAVDGAPTAIELLEQRARKVEVRLETVVADLQQQEYTIQSSSWDLITICYYLQRDLILPAKAGVRPGGVLVMIVHITEGEEQPTPSRLRPGELGDYFNGWQILHSYEGRPNDPAHRRAVAEIVARRPAC